MERIRFTKPCNKEELLSSIRKALPNLRVDYRSDYDEKEIGEKFILVESEGVETINKILSLHSVSSECYNKDGLEKKGDSKMAEEKPVKPEPVKRENALDPPKEVLVPIPSSRKFLDELMAYIKYEFFDSINEKFKELDKRHAENDSKREGQISAVLVNISKEKEHLEKTREELIKNVSIVEGKLNSINSDLETKFKRALEKLEKLEKRLSSIKLVFGDDEK